MTTILPPDAHADDVNRAGDAQIHPGSFRDPLGFAFVHEGVLYRQINPGGTPRLRPALPVGLVPTNWSALATWFRTKRLPRACRLTIAPIG